MFRLLFLIFRFRSLIRLIVSLMLDRRVPFSLKLLVPVGIAYVVSPIDLVPDFLSPLVGRLDDMVVLVLSTVMFITMAPKNVVLEHFQRIRMGTPPSSTNKAKRDGKVIEGSYHYPDEEDESK